MSKNRPFANYADHELLELINDKLNSNYAFEEFYERFKHFVLKICKKTCDSFDNSDQLSYDIFQNTFIKVLYKAHTFQKRGGQEKENYTNEIKAWLSRIARNEFINFLRKNPDEKKLSDQNRVKSMDVEDFIQGPDAEVNEILDKPSVQKNALDKGLALLSEEEKLVLMTYMLYYDHRNPNNHLPDEIIKNLTSKLNIKAASLRQIKSRALKKLMKIKEEIQLTD